MEEKIEKIKFAIHNDGHCTKSDFSFVHQLHIEELMSKWANETMELIDDNIKSGSLELDQLIEILQTFNNLNAFEKLPTFLHGNVHKFLVDVNGGYICGTYNQEREKITEFIVTKIENFDDNKKTFQLFMDQLKLVLGNAYKIASNLEKDLKIYEFTIGRISAANVANLILDNDFEVEGFGLLRQLSRSIIADKSNKELKTHADLLRYFNDIEVTKDKIGSSVILKLQRKIIKSADLDINIDADINEIHIVCDILHIDNDLPAAYLGKNLFVFAKTIKCHGPYIWNISGSDSTFVFESDAGQDSHGNGRDGKEGKPGNSGGNCKIICQKISNPQLWTIQSNGGTGSNGQDGGDGKDGTNGSEIQESDFELPNIKVTNENFLDILEKLNCKTEFGSWRKNYYKNRKEILLVFNRTKEICELLIVTKGSLGRMGGIGGLGGHGGYAGKIEIDGEAEGINIIANVGTNGTNGKCGYNGNDGKDGYYEFKQFENNQICPYRYKHFNINFPWMEDYKPVLSNTHYRSISENILPEKTRINPALKIQKLMELEEKFYKTILSVVKNANCQLPELINDLRLKMFVDGHDSIQELLNNILNNSFDVKDYDHLTDLAAIFIDRSLIVKDEVRSALRYYLEDCKKMNRSSDHLEIKNAIITSDDINTIVNMPEFRKHKIDKVTVTCDVLHVNSSLSYYFRGVSLRISANIININQHVTWDLSGFNAQFAYETFDESRYDETESFLRYTRNGENGSDGGDCIISCQSMVNPSLLTIISNGGNGSDGIVLWNGIGDNGINVKIQDLELPKNAPTKSIFETYKEGNLTKYMAYKCPLNYIILAEGTNAKRADIDAIGLGGQGGLKGNIIINSTYVSDNSQVKKIVSNGKNGKNGDFTTHKLCDGKDAYVIVKNGKPIYFGLNEYNKYKMRKSAFERENSVCINGMFYYVHKTNEIRSYRTILDDIRFYDGLIDILKNEIYSTGDIIENLSLKSFVNYEATLRDVVKNVVNIDIDDKCYKNLQQLAINYYFESPSSHNKFRHGINQMIAMMDIVSSNGIVTVKNMVLKLSDVLNSDFNRNFEELRIVADVFYINCDLPSAFRGKNLAIMANSVDILRPCTLDLSAPPTDPSSEELNGKSGGNFYLNCKSILNSSALTIISNGSDGKDGKNGKDGVDGANGIDATEDDFIFNGEKWKIQKDFFSKLGMNSNEFRCGHFEYVTKNELHVHVFHNTDNLINNSGLMLVQGSNGKAGEIGEPGKCGGVGGRAGTIQIDCKNSNIKKISNPGKNGKDGIGGRNGLNGKPGRDLWKSDSNWTEQKKFGFDYPTKFKLIWTDDNTGETVYDNDKKKYVHIVEDLVVLNAYQPEERNNTAIYRKIPGQLKAKPHRLINDYEIKKEHSGYLAEFCTTSINDNREVTIPTKMRTTSHKFEKLVQPDKYPVKSSTDLKKCLEFYKKLTPRPSRAIRGCEIKYEQFIAEYSRFVNTSLNDVDEILKFGKMSSKIQIKEAEKVKMNFSSPILYKENISEIRKQVQLPVTLSKELLTDPSYLEGIQKRICKFFEEIYQILNAYNSDSDYEYERSQRDFTLDDKLPFMKTCNEFNTGIPSFDQHFEFGDFIPEILEHFNSQVLELTSNLAELIMNLMFKYFMDIDEIAPILKASKERVDYIMYTLKDMIGFDRKGLKWNKTVEDFKGILKRFFTNKNIINFIQNDIYKNRLGSLIYREILAHKSGIKLMMCVLNSNNEIKVLETHNDPCELILEKHETDQTIFVLETKKSYKLLCFQKQNYEHFKLRTVQEMRFNSIASALMVHHEKSFNVKGFSRDLMENIKKCIENQQIEILIKSFLQPEIYINELIEQILQKVKDMVEFYKALSEVDVSAKLSSEELPQIQTDIKGCCSSESFASSGYSSENSSSKSSIARSFATLKHKIKGKREGSNSLGSSDNLSKKGSQMSIDKLHKQEFEKSTLNLTEECNVICEELPSNHLKITNSVDSIIKNFNENILQSLTEDLKKIAELDGSSILMAIATRLSIDSIQLNFEYFSIIIRSIVNILNENNSPINWITFLIYGHEQQDWISELLMMKIEDILGGVRIDQKEKWMDIIKDMKSNPIIYLLLNKLIDSDIKVPKVENMNKIIKNLEYFELHDYKNLNKCELSSWLSIITEKHWDRKLSTIFNDVKLDGNSRQNMKIIIEDLKTQFGSKIDNLLEILNSKSTELVKLNLQEFFNFFKSGQWTLSSQVFEILLSNSTADWIKVLKRHFNSNTLESDSPKIAKYVKLDDEASKGIKDAINSIAEDVREVFEQKCQLNNKKIMKMTENEITEWINSKTKTFNFLEYLAVITRAIQLKTKDKLTLRETQLSAIMAMWRNKNRGILMQMPSGEGKTLVGIAFAILKVLNGEEIDVVVNSNIQVKLNAEYVNIFNFFNIKVDNNNYEDPKIRKEVYRTCQVVYGTLSNFQRDYLLTQFYGNNVMYNHHFKNVIIDEIDSLLLNKDTNIHSLSTEIPDMEQIHTIFLLIWQSVNQNYGEWDNIEFIRKVVLETVFGYVDIESIADMISKNDAEEIFDKLVNCEFLDDDNLMTEKIHDDELLESLLNTLNKATSQRLKLMLDKRIENLISIPKHIKNIIIQHLNEWIESAIQARKMQIEKEYIIDRPSTGALVKSDPKIIIVDQKTGSGIENLEWDNGLHQFLQLKHGCELTPLKFRSAFISNVCFFKKYEKMYAMAGDVGNFEELQQVVKVHEADFVSIPRHVQKKFVEFSAILSDDEVRWLDAIKNECQKMLKEKRSVLIVCDTTQDTKIISCSLHPFVKKLSILKPNSDNSKFEKLEPGQVIIAIDTAARRFDFKQCELLKTNGGLHVILTYLPQSARIENQVFGKTGDKGSGRFIIQAEPDDSILRLKLSRNYNEIQELDKNVLYFASFVRIEDEFLAEFHKHYEQIRAEYPEIADIYQQNFKLQWTFWFDKHSSYAQNCKKESKLHDSFQKLTSKKSKLLPSSRLEMFKKLDDEDFREATDFFHNDKQDESISVQYLTCYQVLKNSQIDNDFEYRTLMTHEVHQLVKTIKFLEELIINHKSNIESICNRKEDNNIIEIQAYEEQQNGMIEIYNTLKNSLKKFLGTEVNFGIINNEVFKKDLTNVLIRKGSIFSHVYSSYFTNDDVKKIATEFNIDFELLRQYLVCNKKKHIYSELELIYDLKQQFTLPNREEFWEVLLRKKIFKNQIKYAVIDFEAAKVFDPSFYEMMIKKLKSEDLGIVKSLDKEENQEHEVMVVLTFVEAIITPERLQRLIEIGVIKIHLESEFDDERYEELKGSKIFDNFDEICVDDFRVVTKNYEGIIKKLTDLMILVSRTPRTYSLNTSMLNILTWPEIFDDDSIYHDAIVKLINYKFTYRLALEDYADNQSTQLPSDPYRQLMNEMINKMIIDSPKVSPYVIHKLTDKLKSLKVDDFKKSPGFNVNEEPFYIETMKQLLENVKFVNENASEIAENLKNCVKSLEREDMETIEVYLEPIEKSLSDSKVVTLAHSKGLKWILKTRERELLNNLS